MARCFDYFLRFLSKLEMINEIFAVRERVRNFGCRLNTFNYHFLTVDKLNDESFGIDFNPVLIPMNYVFL